MKAKAHRGGKVKQPPVVSSESRRRLPPENARADKIHVTEMDGDKLIITFRGGFHMRRLFHKYAR